MSAHAPTADDHFARHGKQEHFAPREAGPANDPGSEDEQESRVTIAATPFVWRDPALIPRREWLYGNHYIRRFPTGTVAPGGVGKTALIITEGIAMASGRNLLGVEPEGGPLTVWFYNLEDPREEIERRIAAAMQHHDVKPEEIAGRIYLDSGRDHPLTIARMERDGLLICEPIIDAMTAELRARSIDSLIVDPFVSCHQLPENNNEGMDAVVKSWGRVANKANCAIELVHHTRKLNGTEITAESARGGQAYHDGLRSLRIIARMTQDEAEQWGLDNPGFYFWMTKGKTNMAPPPKERRDWYRLASVPLANGDDVQAVTPWTPPNPFEGVTRDHLEQAQAAIAAGPNNRADAQAEHWAGYAVADVLGIDIGGRRKKERSRTQNANRSKVSGMLATWVRNGALKRGTEHDDKQRKEKPIYVPGDSWQADD